MGKKRDNLPAKLPRADLDKRAAAPYPALAYIKTLRSWNSQRTAMTSLRRALAILAPDHRLVPLTTDRKGPRVPRDPDWERDPILRLPWHRLSAVHLQAVVATLEHNGAAAPTVTITWYHLRAVLRTAWRLGQYSDGKMKRLDSLRAPRARRTAPSMWLGLVDRQRLWQSCDPTTPKGSRDRMFLALADVHLLRRSECTAILLEDLSPDRSAVRVHRKGGDVDLVTFTAQTRRILERWLSVRGDWAGALLCPVSESGLVIQRGMTPDSLFRILRRKVNALGIQRISPHDLRGGGITDLLAGGIDIAMVAKLAGQSSVQTTQRYDRRGDAAIALAGAARTVPVDVDP